MNRGPHRPQRLMLPVKNVLSVARRAPSPKHWITAELLVVDALSFSFGAPRHRRAAVARIRNPRRELCPYPALPGEIRPAAPSGAVSPIGARRHQPASPQRPNAEREQPRPQPQPQSAGRPDMFASRRDEPSSRSTRHASPCQVATVARSWSASSTAVSHTLARLSVGEWWLSAIGVEHAQRRCRGAPARPRSSATAEAQARSAWLAGLGLLDRTPSSTATCRAGQGDARDAVQAIRERRVPARLEVHRVLLRRDGRHERDKP